MALSRLGQQFAAEINLQDWSDSPYRLDRAGHRREMDSNRGSTVLTEDEAHTVKVNVAWVTAQVLAYNDPNFNLIEYAAACGITLHAGWLKNGLRTDGASQYHYPGTYELQPAAVTQPAS